MKRELHYLEDGITLKNGFMIEEDNYVVQHNTYENGFLINNKNYKDGFLFMDVYSSENKYKNYYLLYKEDLKGGYIKYSVAPNHPHGDLYNLVEKFDKDNKLHCMDGPASFYIKYTTTYLLYKIIKNTEKYYIHGEQVIDTNNFMNKVELENDISENHNYNYKS